MTTMVWRDRAAGFGVAGTAVGAVVATAVSLGTGGSDGEDEDSG
jgi:hypothetical protein